MTKLLALRSTIAVAVFAVVPLCGKEGTRIEYKAKDGSRVVAASKSHREATPESVLEFYSPENQRLCTLDYSSEDGEHGFGIVKAAWTPDGHYFVFSLTSSGGHQAWHSPTLFYSPRDNKIRRLDDYTTSSGISGGSFRLKPPNIVLTEEWRNGTPVPVKFRLDSLTRGPRKSRNAVQCADGKVIRQEG
ncbi:MAG TPA: hypothetical protein VMI32_17405 [Candidatus Solibacter sp.]|nr:hypothetical protein [Candidatus Solibacter sp.]